MQITIQLPDELQQQLVSLAQQRNISLESLILESIAQSLRQIDDDDEPKEVVLANLRQSLQDAKEGKVRPVYELWDGIDD
ncbi:MAG: hypothetical protein U7123_14170 [Potamolinea sp.]